MSAKRAKASTRRSTQSKTKPSRNDGKELERLVAEIERHVLPAGFKVGQQRCGRKAEFDIVITGRVGSSSINWLIECRDRPSQGKAPGSWIEQLVARRERFYFDKVFAVSTTGFDHDAEEYAKSKGIILRTVQKFTDIGSDFQVIRREIKGVSKIDMVPNSMTMTFDPPFKESFELTVGKLPSETEFSPFLQLISRALMADEGWNWKIASPGTHRVNFCITSELEILVGDKTLRATETKGIALCTVETVQCNILTVKRYSEDNRLIGQQVEYKAETTIGAFWHSEIVTVNSDGALESKARKILAMPPNYVHCKDGFRPSYHFKPVSIEVVTVRKGGATP